MTKRDSIPGGLVAVDVGPSTVEEAYRALANELTLFAAMHVPPDDAPDVVANVFARCLRGTTWESVSSPRPYLYRAVYNESMSWRRTLARARLHRHANLSAWGSESVENGGPVTEALIALPRQQRAVIFLTYWQDLHPTQIAELLDMSVGSVKKHLARARSTLRRTMR